MGVDSQMPYLYDGPKQRPISFPYSQQPQFQTPTDNFNPKAVTQASYARLSQQSLPPKPKKEGPLIDFNQHPDSYAVYSGPRPEFKALPPKTKEAVVGVRWAQFGLRLVQMIIALGLLVGTICMKGTDGAETYLLRIPQALDSLITLYAVYHLLRAAKGRTPASSASYHIFALIMDTALVPLYIYIVLLLNNSRQLPVPQYGASGNMLAGKWRLTSVFDTQRGTDLLLLVTFIGAAVIAGLHLLSCGLDLYLIIVFRKISALPPDMNPLEDNLTGRNRSVMKHKYKNSEMTVNSTTSLGNENMSKHMSASTLSVNNQSRLSVNTDTGAQQLPFGHSRNGSKASLAFSPHNPESARISRHQFEGHQDSYHSAATSPRRSRYEMRPDGKLEVRSRGGSQSPSKSNRSSVVVEAMNVSTGDLAMREKDLPTVPAEEIGRALSPDLPHTNTAIRRKEVEGEQSGRLLNDNWYVLDAEDDDDLSRGPTPAPPTSRFAARLGEHAYAPVQHERHDSFQPRSSHASPQQARPGNDDPTLYGYAPEMLPKPLGMHPPTPPDAATGFSDDVEEEEHYGEGVDRNPTNASNMTAGSSVYSESAPSLRSSTGTPKGRYYGSLAAATQGVREAGETSPKRNSPFGVANANAYVGHGRYGLPPSPSRTPSPDKQYGQSRVISRTGADIADESVLYLHPKETNSKYSMRSRREVSGKVAEEGRGAGSDGRGSWGRR
ncbi:hypothetical protein LTR91_013012 [Friedmanniomyces endolithicus]|uniref:Uncharacterized protein n=1 Tax=Friedmanniomyces endolithicus TaxID=329885 RepID=A0AAN6KE83_9PEZI|nr:hypothetical protein LTR57_020135 [Friedmanniomyces endolithicus]KAK0978207.1 hypothetical protein LTR91_013012 [Friedmanniomyces endolithicus]KAK0991965.1 hypothetical protein LTS01_008054 [Friedmanniomyces endolithicus]KAK1033228.1 hypothetical protein LTS16_016460 [Friedmanniomyces endolithicus]